jgi:uncharacterized SAM-binding protein YcdF (DUF218 family)
MITSEAYYIFKKLIAEIISPIPVLLSLFSVGLFLLWCTQKQFAGKIILTASVVLLAVLSLSYIPNLLLRGLERQYPPLREFQSIANVQWVVVLSGGSRFDPDYPFSKYLNESSSKRLFKGIQIQKRLLNSKLLITGSEGVKQLAKTAIRYGIDPQKIITDTKSKDTKDHAKNLLGIVGTNQFVVVTSAFHMPRVMAIFKKIGMQPIPAPTDFVIRNRRASQYDFSRYFPSPNNLIKLEIAVHEYLGIIWAGVKGQI